MKIQYSYLKNFLKTKLSQKKLANVFTQVGFECEIEGEIIEFDLTPNRGDVLSLKGLEREFAAYQSKKSNQSFKVSKLNPRKNKSIIRMVFKRARKCRCGECGKKRRRYKRIKF